jgi:phosphoglycerol transferase
LKPLELFFPPPGYGLADWGQAARVHWDRRIYRGEGGSPYLGIVGAATLAGLFTLTLAAALHRPAKAPPPTAVAIAWILLYSVLGGVNQILGILGFLWLRGTNRFSVWILVLVLLFLVTRRFTAGRFAAVAAALVAAVAIADQVPLRASREALRQAQVAVAGDKAFVAALESSLPPGAMLFMLPLVEFPEGRAVLGADEYEHLRPYLHARRLRFSFGADKGRPRESWQIETASQPPAQMVADLERYGFAGILLDRRAYPRNAADFLADLAAAGRRVTLSHTAGDYVFVPLHPSAAPSLPGHTRVVGAAP